MADERNFLLSQSGFLFVQEGTHISAMVCLPLSRCAAKSNDLKIICNYFHSFKPLNVLSHVAQPNVRCTIDAEWHSLPTVAPERGVKCCLTARLIVKFHLPETITGIKNTEQFCPIQPSCNFFNVHALWQDSDPWDPNRCVTWFPPQLQWMACSCPITTSILDTQSVGWSACSIMLAAAISSSFC